MSVHEITELSDVTEEEVKAMSHFATQSLETTRPPDAILFVNGTPKHARVLSLNVRLPGTQKTAS
jgi:hypothetical protein